MNYRDRFVAPFGRFFQGFSQRILAIALGGFLLSTLVITYSVQHFFKEESRKTILQEQEEFSETVVRHLDNTIRERRENLEAFALLLADGDRLHSKEVIQDLLDQRVVLPRFFNGGMVVLDAEGHSIVDSPRVEGRVGIDFSDRDHVQEARRTAKSVITRPLIGRGLQAPVFVIDTPIKSQSGEVLGFIFGVTRLSDHNLFQDIAELVLGKQSELMVIDPGLKLFVTATDHTLAMQKLPAPGLNPVIDLVLEGRNSGYVAGANGQIVLFASARFETMGWHVIHTLPRSLMTRGEKDILRNMALLTVGGAFIVGLLVWHLLRRQLGFLTQTSNRIFAMAEGRQPFQNLKGERQDEVGQLIVAFNLLQLQLAQHIRRLEQSNHEISRLAEVMAHHFQEPSRRLLIYAKRLTERSAMVEDEDSRLALEFIDQQARRLSRLVGDIQRYLALDHAKEGAEVTVDSAALLREVIAQTAGAAEGEIVLLEPLPKVQLEEKRLRLIFTSLLENAIRYRHSQRPLRIEVEAELRDERVLFRFADNGSGIEPEYRLQVFKLFTRLVPSSTPGTGVGLALVRKIVQQADGSVSVEDGLDGGTAIVFDLPCPRSEIARNGAAKG